MYELVALQYQMVIFFQCLLFVNFFLYFRTGKIDLDGLALLASTCGNAAAATAALVEKRFAQSRQELLEQRHQELLRKQRQLQEQYTRLQLLSRGQIPKGFLNELKKTGSESNIVAKAITGGETNKCRGVMLSSTVHGSLRNLSLGTVVTTVPQPTTTITTGSTMGKGPAPKPPIVSNGNDSKPEVVTKKIFETDIL